MKIPPHDSFAWNRIAPYLDRALELNPQERKTWIDELTTTEPDIAQAVRQLIHERDELGAKGFLENSPVDKLTTLTGTRVGAYTIERLLGRGGMGEVWLAARNDGRFEGKCAIKFLCSATVYPQLVDRFRREGTLLARLAHPNIARLFDAGATDDGAPYLALEYIDGDRIDRYCDAKALSIEARVRLFVDVVAAVAHAHTHLIVHRDLKPSNVLVTRDGQVKLLDFGVAKLLSTEPAAVEQNLTRIEDVALTPEYAAPEQMLGELPSTATDVYQLGMLLYVLLTGKHPLKQTATRAEKIRAALDDVVPRASEFADAGLRDKLQGDLDAILSMALRKIPSERYATAQALMEELLRYLNHEPVLARRGVAWYRARKFVGRHRFSVTASAIALIGICSALVFSLVQMRAAQAQRDQAQFETARADASSQFMSLMLEEVGTGEHPPTMPDLLERAEQLLDKQYGGDRSFIAAMLIDLAGRYLDIGRSQKALALLVRSASIAQAVNDDTLLARALCFSAYSHLQSSSPDLADSDMARARAALKRVSNPSVELLGGCLRTEGRLAQHKGDQAAALNLLGAARELYERDGATKGLQYTAVLTNIGGLHLANGRLAESYSAFKKADDAFDRNGRGGTVGKLTAESNLAIPLARMGEVLAASRLMQHVIQRSTLLRTSQSSRLAYVLNYAHLLTRLDRGDEAWKLLQESNEHMLVEDDPTFIAGARFQMGRALFSKGDFAAAERLIVQAEQGFKESAGPNAYSLRAIALERARNDLMRGKTNEARQKIERLLHELNYPQLRAGVELRNALLLAADIYLRAGQPQQASDCASSAYDIAIQLARLADESADVGEAAYQFARAQQVLGHTESLRPALMQAVKSLTNGLGVEHHLTRDAVGMLAGLKS